MTEILVYLALIGVTLGGTFALFGQGLKANALSTELVQDYLQGRTETLQKATSVRSVLAVDGSKFGCGQLVVPSPKDASRLQVLPRTFDSSGEIRGCKPTDTEKRWVETARAWAFFDDEDVDLFWKRDQSLCTLKPFNEGFGQVLFPQVDPLNAGLWIVPDGLGYRVASTLDQSLQSGSYTVTYLTEGGNYREPLDDFIQASVDELWVTCRVNALGGIRSPNF